MVRTRLLIALCALLAWRSGRSEGAPVPESVTFRNGSVSLAGTLYLPVNAVRHPAVVVFHAANGPTRDFEAYRHLATILPGAGVAVLLFDRRGSGGSTGVLEEATFLDLARDGIAGIAYLKTRQDIDATRIGVWGMSQGGWLAMLAASLSKDIAFAISVSGPGVSPAAQMDYSAAYALRESGQPSAVIDQALKVRAIVNDYYRGRERAEKAQEAIDGIRNESWFSRVYLPLPNSGKLPAHPRQTKWYREMDYDPLGALSRVRVPVAVFFARTDPWVPVDESIQNIRRVTRAPLTVSVIDGVDHFMASRSEGEKPQTSETYQRQLLDWLIKVCDH